MPTPAPSHPSSGLTLLFGLAFGQLVAWGSTYYLFAILLEAVRTDLGVSRSTAAGAYSVGLLVSGLAALPIGLLVDRGRHYLVLVGGSALCVAGLLLHAAVSTAWQLYAVWIVLGIGMACTLYDPVFAFLIRHHPTDYRRRITFVTLLGGLASTVFWPLSAWMVDALGWRWALVGLAAIHAVCCLANHALVVPRMDGAPVSSAARRAAAPALIRSPVFACLALAFVLQSIVIGAMGAHVIALFAAFGVSSVLAVAAASSIGVMQVAGRLVLLAIEPYVGAARTALIIIWLLPVALAAFFAIGLAPWFVFGFALLYGAGNGMMTIVKGTAAADLISRDHVATLNGALAMPNAFARAAGPLLLAATWDATHDPHAPIALMLAMAAVAAIALLLAVRFAHRPATLLR